MNQRRRQPPADPYRKARFREEARGIVAKDRYDRKYGRVVDTAGAIARALERAYKQGFGDAKHGFVTGPLPSMPDDGPLEWELIPPRPRAAFWSCCLFIFGKRGEQPRLGQLEPDITERGTAGWRLVVAGFKPEKSMGGNTIRPLIRLGLLVPAHAAPHRLVVSDRGRATWEQFLARGGEFPDDLTSF